MDAHTVDCVEHASVRAEEAVQPFLRSRLEPWFAGRSIVTISFLDAETSASFRRTRAVRAVSFATWRLVRRWADADDDGALDEMMCRVVALQLNSDFAGLLRAGVMTFIPPHAR